VGNASGYDQVSVRAMKACKHELIPYLVHSINCSMNSNYYLIFNLDSGRSLSTTAATTEIVDEILGAIDGKKIVAGLFLDL
jgi:hypothetical protein